MSFILDALRKSEHERQRRAGPAIADLVVAPQRSNAMPVLIGIGALLAINLAAVAYFALRDEPLPAGATTVEAAPAAATPEVAVPPAGATAMQQPANPVARLPRAVRPLVAEAGPAGPVSMPVPDATPPAAPDPLLLPPPGAQRPPAPVAGPGPAATGDYVPRLDTLPPQATAGLPVLNLDLHIYASDPAKRAVFINGRRYREGDSLPEGIEVVAITADGAVLRHRAQRFLLSRH